MESIIRLARGIAIPGLYTKYVYLMVPALCFLAVLFSTGCSKDEQPVVVPVPSTDPVVVGFSPTSGSVGTVVIILGSNFSSAPESNVVRFGGKRSVVDTAGATRLVTSVPMGAIPGPATISVTVKNVTATGQIFTVTTPPELNAHRTTTIIAR